MKARAILITSFLLLITFELINSASTQKTKLTKKSKRFMQGEEEEEQQKSTESTESIESTEPTELPTTIIPTQRQIQESETDPFQDEVPDNKYSDYQFCKEFLKPSTAFTVILMIYMVLIIVGGVLVLVLLKKDLEQ